MELTELKAKIIHSFSGNNAALEKILHAIENDKSIFPFNEYEHLICHLLEMKCLSFENYIDIRNEYISENPNLWIFEISAPRGFGEKFAQTYVQAKCSALKMASKKLDSHFRGEYDLYLDGIKIEVKASRAVDRESDKPLYMKALSMKTQRPFLMNFQQLKPQCCDVFLWLAVFRDGVTLWVMNSNEVASHALYSQGQHRGNIGNEGQLHITHENIHLFKIFELQDDNLEKAIKDAVARRNFKMQEDPLRGSVTDEKS